MFQARNVPAIVHPSKALAWPPPLGRDYTMGKGKGRREGEAEKWGSDH